MIVSIPGLSFFEINSKELTQYPQLKQLIMVSSIGALNTRTPFKGVEDTYVTLGAGAFATSLDSYNGLHHDELSEGETAEILYQRYQNRIFIESEIMVPHISSITKLNLDSAYLAKPGLLGDTLERAGIERMVFGNRDKGLLLQRRQASLLLMNKDGLIPEGVINERSLINDITRPFGVKTNYELFTGIVDNIPSPVVILFELGDLDRLYEEKNAFSVLQFQAIKQLTMKEMEAFLMQIKKQMKSSDALLVLSPQVHQEAMNQKSMLTPFIWHQSNQPLGLVQSQTTRRPGLISILDVAPTILHYFGLPIPQDMIGFPITTQVKERQDSPKFTTLQKEVHVIEKVYQLRPKLLYPFVVYEVIVLLSGILLVLFFQGRIKRWMIIPFISTLAAPFVLLLMSWLYKMSNPLLILYFFALILILSLLFSGISLFGSMGIISALTVGFILFDGLWMNESRMKSSVFGYDPMIGARYYGIGNEYMGVLIGAAILMVSMALHYFHQKHTGMIKYGSIFIFLLILFYLGSPGLGTNAGGAITAMVAFGIVWIRMFGGGFLK